MVWYILGLLALSVSDGVHLLRGSSDSFKVHHITSRADVRAQIESSVLQQVKGNMETEDKGSDITGRKKGWVGKRASCSCAMCDARGTGPRALEGKNC